MSLQVIVDFIYKRINEKSELKIKITEEIVKEYKKHWIKNNKRNKKCLKFRQ